MTSSKSAKDFRLFHTPIQGVANGQPVTILGTGDVPGNSPSYLCVNAQGESEWHSFDNVRITDQRYLPASNEQLQNAMSATSQNVRSAVGTSR